MTTTQRTNYGVKEIAKLLVNAQNPLIIAGSNAVRSQEGVNLIVELAETLQASVQNMAVEQGKNARAMPTHHPLHASGGGPANADVILALEVEDVWGATNNMLDQQIRTSRPTIKPGTKLINISTKELYTKSNYQDFQRYQEVDLAIAADAEATLPSLIEAVKRLITSDRKQLFRDRGVKLAATHQRSLEQPRCEHQNEQRQCATGLRHRLVSLVQRL